VLYPATGTTKADVFGYYTAIAGVMLPHLIGRPATRKRWPDGVDEPSFFEKALPKSAPDWLTRGNQVHRSGTAVYPIIDSTTALAWIAQQAALEIHVPQWRFGADGRPGPANRLVFDLDPDEGLDFEAVRKAAFHFREILQSIGLKTFPMVTGGKGIHVIAPLTGQNDWADVKAFAKGLAAKVAGADPERYINVMSKAKRTGRIFVDWLRNDRGATAIAPYSPRARAGAPVAWPVSWHQLGSIESASAFTVRSAVAHPPRTTPWDGYKDVRQSISPSVLKAIGERVTSDRG
jgi:bifunctional non-homologous end joining protein LigD